LPAVAASNLITVPGRKLRVTLRDVATEITKLPKAEHDAEEWQTTVEALLLVAEHVGPVMFARIGVMRALNRHVERVFNPDRKENRSEPRNRETMPDRRRN
jgi:hypothetical protein